MDALEKSCDRVEKRLDAIGANADRLSELLDSLKKRQDLLAERLDVHESDLEMSKLINEVSVLASNGEDVEEMRVSLEQMEALARPSSRDRGVSLRH